MIICRMLESCCGATNKTYANPTIINNIPKAANTAIIMGILGGTGGKKASFDDSVKSRSLQT